MLNPTVSHLPDYPFQRLTSLLSPHSPGGAVTNLALGEPQHPFPDFAVQALLRDPQGFRRYPPTPGPDSLRGAIKAWIDQRYGLDTAMIDPQTMIHPVSGTREALFQLGQLCIPAQKAGQTPLVVFPDPFYQPYLGAALLNGAEPRGLPAQRQTNHMPDFASLSEADWARMAMIMVCSPANPQGTTLSLEDWKTLIQQARASDTVLVADECYSELYEDAPDGDGPPVGALEACRALGGSLDNVLVVNSLSKRSNAAGLRSGFLCGDPALLAPWRRLRAYSQAGTPLPLADAAIALWQDEAHVVENRRLYTEKRQAARALLGDRPGFEIAPNGFFLWLDVGAWGYDGEEAALLLWQRHGLRTLPGRYMTLDPDDPNNPGQAYLRIALVHPIDIVRPALDALAETLLPRV